MTNAKYTFTVLSPEGLLLKTFTAKPSDTLEDIRCKIHILLIKKLNNNWNSCLNFTMNILILESESGRPTSHLIIPQYSPKLKYQVKTIWTFAPDYPIEIKLTYQNDS